MTTPTHEPLVIVAGDSYSWKRTVDDYLASDGWKLVYYLTSDQIEPIKVESTADGDDHVLTLSAQDSAKLVAGCYSWALRAEKDGEVKTLVRGDVDVRPDPTTKGDHRSFWRQVLDIVERVLTKTASHDDLKYQIEGRSLERRSIPELLALRDRAKLEVENEQRTAGQRSRRSTTVRARFVND